VQTSPPDTVVSGTVPAPAPVPVPTPVGATESRRSWTTPVLWALLVVALVGVVIGAVPLAKRLRRRARRRRRDPSGRVAGAWEEAVDRLRELGRPAPRTTTPTEHARAATATVGESAARSLAAVADAHTAAQFAAAAPTDADADAAWQDLDAFTGALGRHVPLTTRVRARLRVGSLRSPRDHRDERRDGQLEAVGASAVRSSSTND
jgi:hypothetical protein